MKKSKNEKTIYRMGENICKQCDWKGVNIQSTQTAHTAQYYFKKEAIRNIESLHVSMCMFFRPHPWKLSNLCMFVRPHPWKLSNG